MKNWQEGKGDRWEKEEGLVEVMDWKEIEGKVWEGREHGWRTKVGNLGGIGRRRKGRPSCRHRRHRRTHLRWYLPW